MAGHLGKVRGVFVGSGSDGLNMPAVRDAILKLVLPRPAKAMGPGSNTSTALWYEVLVGQTLV